MATDRDDAQGLPNTRDLLASLITSIVGPTEQSPNPLLNTTARTKNIILTLHTLFPNQLLPALDLLDRNLVTHFRTTPFPDQSTSCEGLPAPTALDIDIDDTCIYKGSASDIRVYYVTSAQQASTNPRSKYRSENPVYYEVRLQAWSCSCPAFAFSAFPAVLSDEPTGHGTGEDGPSQEDGSKYGWRFGGLAKGSDAPVCKHLLACVLVEHCAGFAHLVEDKDVTVEEMAGWAAGWGD